MTDDDELNKLMASFSVEVDKSSRSYREPRSITEIDPLAAEGGAENLTGYCQWSTSDGKRFIPTTKTRKKLVPAAYDIKFSNNIGIYFEQIPVLATDLINFPETNSEKVVEEIQKFWTKEEVFKEYKLTYKRGIILWGPPGSGKSCTIQLIMRDVIDRGGIVVRFTDPSLFIEGMRRLREIQPDTPIVILMEDIDSILEHNNESDVLNILDGINQVDKVVFLATTNYPEKLGPRIINRPSRFDKRFKIPFPSAESRKIYFEHVIGKDKIKKNNIPIDKWVSDTEDFSISHLKELFTAVVILGDDYDEAINVLSNMREESISSSEDDYKSPMGFAQSSEKKRYNR